MKNTRQNLLSGVLTRVILLGILLVSLSVCTLLNRFAQMGQLHLINSFAKIIQCCTDGVKGRSCILFIISHP